MFTNRLSRSALVPVTSELLEGRLALTAAFVASALSGSPIGIVGFLDSDLDGDGDVDLIVASEGDDRISWYENVDGAGDFSERQAITNQVPRVSRVLASDLDGDGDTDLVSRSHRGRLLAWYENLDGDGVFGDQKVVNERVNGAAAADLIIDLDGDSDFDLLSYSRNGDEWFENGTGNGDFVLAKHIDHRLAGNLMLAADFNDDGYADLLAYDGTLTLYLNDGVGQLSEQIVLASGTIRVESASSADMDGDGDLDILVTFDGPNGFDEYPRETWWYENDGERFSTRHLVANKFLESMLVADADGDGDMDVLSLSGAYEQTEGGVFREFELTTAPTAKLMLATDIDGDGLKDTVFVTSEDHILWNKNHGQLEFVTQEIAIETTEGQSAVGSIHTVDLDGDDDLDVVISPIRGSRAGGWHENENGTFQQLKPFPPGAVFPLDVDNDGDLDLVSEGGWYDNEGGGRFDWERRTLDSITQIPDDAIDLDDDGLVDLVFENTREFAWFRRQIDGTYRPAGVIRSDVRINFSELSDIDGDGDLDLLLATHDREITWYENLGGERGFGEPHPVTSDAFNVKSADIDGDGDLDVLAASSTREQAGFYVLRNTGTGLFEEPVFWEISGAGGHAYFVDAADLDGDGDLDLTATTGTKHIWLENTDGTGDFSAGWSCIGRFRLVGEPHFGDFDRDGDIDIVTAEPKRKSVVLFENYSMPDLPTLGDADKDGRVSFADFLILSANFGKKDALFADGDFNEDGRVSFKDFQILSSNFATLRK